MGRRLLSAEAAIFYSLFAVMTCGFAHHGSRAALLLPLGQQVLAGSVALWTLRDARRRGQAVSFDFGTYVFGVWSIFAPVYLFVTRVWRGFAPLGWFVVLALLAALLGSVPSAILQARH